MKSMNMISSTGRRPDCAAPIATPVIAASLIGVLITRSAPNSSARPAVAVYGPPSATSSPRTNTRSSARIAAASVGGDRLDVGRLRHPRRPARSISSTGGNGLSRAKRSATLDLRGCLCLDRAGVRRARGVSRAIGSFCCHSSASSASRYAPGIAFVVAAQPMRQALEQKRAVARPGLSEEAAERVPDRADVGALHGRPLDVIRRNDVAHPLDVRVGRARRELGEAVVLAHENQRQPPERREVHGLVEDATLDRAVAEEHDRDGVVAAQARREGAAERDRDVAADDPGRPHEPVLGVDEVHRAAEATTQTRVAAEQLGQQAIEGRALCDRVPVCPVARVHGIVVAQLAAHRSRDALAADAQMDQSLDLAGPHEHADLLLEEPDPPHRREQALGLRGVHYAVDGRRPEHLLHGGDDLVLVGQDPGLERLAVRDRRVDAP